MTNSPLWRKFESGDALFFKAIRGLVMISGILLLTFTGVLELTWPQQTVLGIIMIALIIWLDRSSTSYLVTLALMLVSIFSTFRYGYWRVSTTFRFFLDPGSVWTALDAQTATSAVHGTRVSSSSEGTRRARRLRPRLSGDIRPTSFISSMFPLEP